MLRGSAVTREKKRFSLINRIVYIFKYLKKTCKHLKVIKSQKLLIGLKTYCFGFLSDRVAFIGLCNKIPMNKTSPTETWGLSL